MTPTWDALVAALDRPDLTRPDAAVLDAAARRVFDTIASVRVGLQTADGIALRRAQTLLAGRDGGLPADRVALAVGAARATEMDDIHPGACVTAGAIVVPTAILVGTQLDCDDGAVLRSVIAGYELAIRLGQGIGGPAALAAGTWPTLRWAPVVAALVAARLTDADAATTARALALADASARPARGDDAIGLPSRWLAVGHAARDGLVAAAAAQTGIRAVVPAPDLAEPGDAPAILAVEAKPFAASRQGLPALLALLAALEARSDRAAIAQVDLDVPQPFVEMLTEPAADRWSSLVSLPAQARVAIDEPERLWDPVRGDELRARVRERTRARTRVVVHGDPDLTRLLPERWAGRARVSWADGRHEVAEVHGLLDGDHHRDWSAVAAKWRRAADAIGDPADWLTDAQRRCRALGDAVGSSAPRLAEILDDGFDDPKEN